MILQVSAMGPLHFFSMFQCGSGSTCWSPKFLLGKPWFKISKWSQIYDPEAWIASKNHGENHKFQLEKTKSSSFMIHGLVPKPAMFVVDRNMVLEKGGVDTLSSTWGTKQLSRFTCPGDAWLESLKFLRMLRSKSNGEYLMESHMMRVETWRVLEMVPFCIWVGSFCCFCSWFRGLQLLWKLF